MNVHEAIDQACQFVGIKPPKSHREGHWTKTDTTAGKSGKGDGRLMVDDLKVVSWNWQTGEKHTVWLNGEPTEAERKVLARKIGDDQKERERKAAEASKVAAAIIAKAYADQHQYLVDKGFPHERVLVLDAASVRVLGGAYLVPDGAAKSIVIPAKIGANVSSLQLIWENGQKKFLAGGAIEGSSHRIATGAETWLCEGFATGLALRAALKGLGRRPTILCCFSAYNVSFVARHGRGKRIIATDNDKPMPQYDGLGTGEHWAKLTGLPYVMPPELGMDFNDMLMRDGIFAVQRHLSNFAREARM